MTLLVVLVFALISLAARCHGVHDRISTQVRNNQFDVSAALAQYASSKNDVTLEIASEVDITRRLINAIPELTSVLAENLVFDYFYAGASRISYAAEQLRKVDPSLTELYISLINGLGKSGQATFVRCVSTNNLETNFRQVIQSLNQRLFQLGLEEFGFKAALASCSSKAVVLSKKTPQCIAYVLTTNPYPKFNSSGLQTVRSLQKIYDCLVEGASRTRIAGDNIIGALKERLPQELQYLLPNMFSGRFQPSISLPSTNSLTLPSEIANKLASVKVAWAKAKVLYDDAVSTKGYTLAEAINHLKLEQDFARSFINTSQEAATAEEQHCYIAAKAAYEASVNTNANKWLQCIASGQIPTSQAVAALETSLKEREIKERSLTPLVDCAKRTENLFDTDLMGNCLLRAREDYWSFLVEFELKTEALEKDSSDFLTQENRCHCDADMQARRDVREEVYKLRTCVTKTSHIRFLTPDETSCVFSRCSK